MSHADSSLALRAQTHHAAGVIGVFDSGVGGLSVLRALHRRLPSAAKIYLGDVAHAPYGERNAAQVIERCERIVEWLIDGGAQVIVVACNTATALAIDHLRERWPRTSFVGVEPGVKPAILRSRVQRIAVMATPATAASARLRALIARYAAAAHVHVQPCAGLADAIEHGTLDGPALDQLLRPWCDAMRRAEVDVVALGCTHYPFIAESIAALLGPQIVLLDTAAAVAERTAGLWRHHDETSARLPSVRVVSTGHTQTMRRLLQRCAGLERLPVEVERLV